MCCRQRAAGGPHPGVHPVAQGNHGRRRRRVANGKAEVGEDRVGPLARHGAAPRELQQGRSVEALQHEAEAPLQEHHTEHLRRRGAGGEDGVSHVRLVPVEPPRRAWPEQLHDLTGRPGMDLRGGAFTDLLAQGSPHRPSSVAASTHPAAGKDKPIDSFAGFAQGQRVAGH